MKAFIEPIFRPSLIVRVGEKSESYGKPFDYAVQVTIPWRSAFVWMFGGVGKVILKALVNPEKKPIPLAHSLAMVRILQRHRLNPTWETFPNG